VAQLALVFCVAAGAKCYVTSSSEEKIAKAKSMGSLGGVNYRNENWEKGSLFVCSFVRSFVRSFARWMVGWINNCFRSLSHRTVENNW
jgi:hypothetical protein